MIKRGRPTKYSKELAETICERLAEGEGLVAICEDEAIPNRATVYRWIRAHEDFRDMYARAREAQADWFFEEILKIADDGSSDWTEKEGSNGSTYTVVDHENIARSKLRVDARKWVLAKMLPKKFGDRSTLEVKDDRREPSDYTDAELVEIIRRSGGVAEED